MSLARQDQYIDAILMLSRDGISPSYEEIGREVGTTSKGTVARMVRVLESAGRLRRMPDRARAIEVVCAKPVADAIYLEGDNFNLIAGPKSRTSFLAWYCATYPAEVR